MVNVSTLDGRLRVLRLLLRGQGEWRSELMWRLFGYSMIQMGLLYATFVHSWELFSAYGLQWLFGSGAVLVVGGGRIGAIVLSWLLLLPHYATRIGASAEVQLGEEYGLLLSVPVLGIGAILTGALSATATTPQGPWQAILDDDPCTRQAVDKATISLFRIVAVSTLFWATAHKLNTDFLIDAVSCGPLLAKQLGAWWDVPLPAFVVAATPLHIVMMEGLCPLLLLLAPRLGLIWTTLLIGVIGHRGATAFVVLAVGVSLSYLRSGDKERITAATRRYWPLLALLTAALGYVSAARYIGMRHWYEFALMQAVLLGALLTATYLLVDDTLIRLGVGRPGAMRPTVEHERPWLNQTRAGRTFIAIVCLVYALNGLTPYLGWKYRLSFAMLSNLRVDDTRWNSLIFPKAMRMQRFDEHVHIDTLHADYRAQSVLASFPQEKRALREGLISPISLDYRMKFVRFHRLKVDLELRYKGEEFFFRDVANNEDFAAWLSGLPKTNLIQEYLSSEGPQPCTH